MKDNPPSCTLEDDRDDTSNTYSKVAHCPLKCASKGTMKVCPGCTTNTSLAAVYPVNLG